MHCLTFDLEDWFHFLDLDSTLDIADWGSYESHVERMTDGLLTFLDRHDQKATFFVLGWVAEAYPNLVREVAQRGHEIACHSYSHPLIYKMSTEAFESDLVVALDRIEAASGARPTAFRAPGFSITNSCLWAFDILRKHGILFDSSVFPAGRAHGGLPGAPTVPFVIETAYGDLIELPLSTSALFHIRFVFSGGGYFRLIPGATLSHLFREAAKRGEPVMTYFHPRDFYADAPIPNLPPHRRFKARVGLAKSYDKLARLLCEESFGPLADYTGEMDPAQMDRRSTAAPMSA